MKTVSIITENLPAFKTQLSKSIVGIQPESTNSYVINHNSLEVSTLSRTVNTKHDWPWSCFLDHDQLKYSTLKHEGTMTSRKAVKSPQCQK